MGSRSTIASRRSARTTALRQNKYRSAGKIAIPWIAAKVLHPVFALSCGVGFPLKSNLGIAEEVERMASYLSPPGAVYCPARPVPTILIRCPSGISGAYVSFGKTVIGNPRWRCSVCGKTFSRNTKATARQRDHHKNKTIFKLLVNKMPVRRIIEVTDIAPQTFYHRLAFSIASARHLLPVGARLGPTLPSAGYTSAWIGRTIW